MNHPSGRSFTIPCTSALKVIHSTARRGRQETDAPAFHGNSVCQRSMTFSGFRSPRGRFCYPKTSEFFMEERSNLLNRNVGGWQCISASFLMSRSYVAEDDESKRQSGRHHALLSLCLQAMVASQMAQSPFLSFIWTNWPSLVDQLSVGGQGGGKNSFSRGLPDDYKEPDNVSWGSSWRTLVSGFAVGAAIVAVLNSQTSVGAMVDACMWLCLLCSILLLAGWSLRTMFYTAVFIARGGVRTLGQGFNGVLQDSVRRSFCRGVWPGAPIACILCLTRDTIKSPKSSHLFLTSLWSKLGKRVVSRKNGRVKLCERGKHLGFLQNVLLRGSKV